MVSPLEVCRLNWYESLILVPYRVRKEIGSSVPLCRSSGSAATTIASAAFGAGGAHFPKTVKEELEQGFNALVVVESRLPCLQKNHSQRAGVILTQNKCYFKNSFKIQF